jgi:hypothetical protein
VCRGIVVVWRLAISARRHRRSGGVELAQTGVGLRASGTASSEAVEHGQQARLCGVKLSGD